MHPPKQTIRYTFVTYQPPSSSPLSTNHGCCVYPILSELSLCELLALICYIWFFSFSYRPPYFKWLHSLMLPATKHLLESALATLYQLMAICYCYSLPVPPPHPLNTITTTQPEADDWLCHHHQHHCVRVFTKFSDWLLSPFDVWGESSKMLRFATCAAFWLYCSTDWYKYPQIVHCYY